MSGVDRIDYKKAGIPRWAVLFRQKRPWEDGGYHEHLIRDRLDDMNRVKLFRTRREARDWARKHYGYISRRPDLKAAPHHWLPVKVVKITTQTLIYE